MPHLHDPHLPIELLTPAEMGQADALAIAGGIAGFDLMLRAGAAVADRARQMLTPGKSGPDAATKIVVLCGPGNNGGDGFVAARFLQRMGFEVEVGLLGSCEALAGDAARASQFWSGPVSTVGNLRLQPATLIIDALFGAGLSRPLAGAAADLVSAINDIRKVGGARVLAVDVPSGLDGATGAAIGACIEADASVTFFRLKPGHVLEPGRSLCGEIVLEQIGIDQQVLAQIAPRATLNAPALWRDHWPALTASGHKYSRGHVQVLSGERGKSGAARLAAHAALRAGAGLVTLLSPPSALAENAAHLTAVLLEPVADVASLLALLRDARRSVWIMGPGAGVADATRSLVETVLAAKDGQSLVLDADALTVFAGDPDRLAGAIKSRPGAVVMTPHEGEFERLFKALKIEPDSVCEPPDSMSHAVPDLRQVVQPGKLARARAGAAFSGAIVVLKGRDTVIAAPDGRAAVNVNAPTSLATAGSGDTLAGMVGGLLAQGMPAFEAACAAVWLHGEAARSFGHGLIAEDLADTLPAVLRAF